MKAYRMSGSFLMGGKWQSFSKEVAAKNPTEALDFLLSDLGSKHRVSRKFVNVDNIEEIPSDKVENPVVKWKIGGKK